MTQTKRFLVIVVFGLITVLFAAPAIHLCLRVSGDA